MKRKIIGRVLTAGLSLANFFAICTGSYAQQASIPSFDSLHLESWSPKNDFRPIRQLGNNGSASFGFNEEFIWGYIQSKGVACSGCATNSPAIPLAAAQSYLSVLSKHGVHIAREIVPERYMGDASNFPFAATVFKEYQKRNFIVILTLAWPVSGAPGKCYGFGESGLAFDRASYEYSVAVARLLQYLRGSGIDASWLDSRVLIEPWNEFSGICKLEVGSPQKAARYQGIMQLVFDYAGVKNEVLMPSIINAYKGGLSRAPHGKYDKLRIYLSDYYASGGSGRPNIHLYYDPHWTNDAPSLAGVLESEFELLDESLPAPYKQSTLIGETGIAASSSVPKCNAHAVPDQMRDALYTRIIGNPSFRRKAQAVLFWRLFGLEGLTPEALNCDQFYGVISNHWRNVDTPITALGTFSRTGLDMLEAIQHPKIP